MAARRGQLSSKIPRDQALSGMRSWCPGWDPGTCRGRDSVGPPALPPPPPAREPRAPSGTSCRDHLRAGAGPAPRCHRPGLGSGPLEAMLPLRGVVDTSCSLPGPCGMPSATRAGRFFRILLGLLGVWPFIK